MEVVPQVPVLAWLADKVRMVVRISHKANALQPLGSENSLVTGLNEPDVHVVVF